MGGFNPNFLAIKLYNFFFFGGFACFIPYLTPFGRFLGLSYPHLGYFWCIWPLIGMISKPIIGKLADTFNAHRTVLIICVLITGALQLALWWLPTIEQVPSITFSFNCASDGIEMRDSDFFRNINVPELKTCPGSRVRPATCSLSEEGKALLCFYQSSDSQDECVKTLANSTLNILFNLTNPENVADATDRNSVYSIKVNEKYTVFRCPESVDTFQSSSCDAKACGYEHHEGIAWTSTAFWLLFFIVCMVKVVQSSAISLGDAITFGLLAKFKRFEGFTSTYGFQRSFGTLGWLVIALATGFLLEDWLGTDKKNSGFEDIWDFAPIFIGQAVLFFLAAVAATGFRSISSPHAVENARTNPSKNSRGKVWRLLICDADAVLFCLATVVVGMATGILYAFFADFMLREMKAPKYAIGITLAVETASEFPIMMLSHSIIRAIGHRGAMTLALLSFCIRYVTFSWLIGHNYWWILLPELLHCLGFGLFYANMAMFANSIAPPGASATVQGIIGGIYEGFGVGIGGFVSSNLIPTMGYERTWRWFGYFCGAVAVLYLLLSTLAGKNSARRSNRRQSAADERGKNDFPPDENDGPYVTMVDRSSGTAASNGTSSAKLPPYATVTGGQNNFTPPSFVPENDRNILSLNQYGKDYDLASGLSVGQRARMLATIEDLDEEDLRL